MSRIPSSRTHTTPQQNRAQENRTAQGASPTNETPTTEVQSTERPHQTDNYQAQGEAPRNAAEAPAAKAERRSQAYGNRSERGDVQKNTKAMRAALDAWKASGQSTNDSPKAITRQAETVIQEMRAQGMDPAALQAMENTRNNMEEIVAKNPDLGTSSDPKAIAKQQPALTSFMAQVQVFMNLIMFACEGQKVGGQGIQGDNGPKGSKTGKGATTKGTKSAAAKAGTSPTSKSSRRGLEQLRTKPADKTEKAEKKGFWGSVFGFFKKAFSFAKKVLDFAMPFVGMIPGVGTMINAAYQGINCIVSLVNGDYAGALTSLLGTLGGVGKMIGGAVNVAMQIGTKVVQAGKGLVNAIKSGDPMAILSGVGDMVMGCLGQVGGTVTKVAKGIKQGLDIAKTGVYTVQGFVEGNIDKAIAGLGSMVGGATGMMGGSAAGVGKHLNTALQAAGHIANGRFDAALTSAAGAVSGFAATPQTKPLFDGLQMGAQAFNSIMNGNYANAANQVLAFAGTQSGDASVQRATAALGAGVRFFQGLSKGSASQALEGLSKGLGQATQEPGLQKAISWFASMTQIFEKTQQQEPAKTAQHLQQSQPLAQLFSAAQNGSLAAGIHQFAGMLAELSNSSHATEAMSWVKDGTQFVQALMTGGMEAGLKAIQQSQNAPSALKTVLSVTQQLKGFVSHTLDGSIDQGMKALFTQQPQAAQQPALQELGGFLNSFSGLFQGLLTGNFAQGLNSAFSLFSQTATTLGHTDVAQGVQQFQTQLTQALQGFAKA